MFIHCVYTRYVYPHHLTVSASCLPHPVATKTADIVHLHRNLTYSPSACRLCSPSVSSLPVAALRVCHNHHHPHQLLLLPSTIFYRRPLSSIFTCTADPLPLFPNTTCSLPLASATLPGARPQPPLFIDYFERQPKLKIC